MDAMNDEEETEGKWLTGQAMDKKPLVCDDCCQIFDDKEALNSHLVAGHNEEKPLVCCGTVFQDKESLACHIETHKDYFVCKLCQMMFTTESGLKEHSQTHSDEKPVVCDLCHEILPSTEALELHNREVHLNLPPESANVVQVKALPLPDSDVGQRPFHDRESEVPKQVTGVAPMYYPTNPEQEPEIHRCPYCPKEFKSRYYMEGHLLTHTGDKPHKCPLCDKAYLYKQFLKAHVEKNHPDVKVGDIVHENSQMEGALHKCPYCDKVSKKKYYMKAHIKTHTGEKPHQCPHCDKAYPYKESLNGHIERVHNEGQHECKVCGKSFHKPHALEKHTRLHTGEKPYECDVCGRTFASKSNCCYHKLRMHSAEKNEECPVCGKAFSMRSQVLRHMRKIHTGDKKKKTSTRKVDEDELDENCSDNNDNDNENSNYETKFTTDDANEDESVDVKKEDTSDEGSYGVHYSTDGNMINVNNIKVEMEPTEN